MVGLQTLVNRKCSKMGSHHITLNIDNKMTSDDFTIANYFKNKKKIQKKYFYLLPQLRKMKM